MRLVHVDKYNIKLVARYCVIARSEATTQLEA
jgi:hypothetical protein